MMPSTRTDFRGSDMRGEMTCPRAPPIGFATERMSGRLRTFHDMLINIPMDINMVAVVLPLTSNHVSEYFGART